MRCGWLLVCRRQPFSQRDGLRCGALRHGGGCDDVPLERVQWKLHGRERELLPGRGHQQQRCHVSDGVLVCRRRQRQGRVRSWYVRCHHRAVLHRLQRHVQRAGGELLRRHRHLSDGRVVPGWVLEPGWLGGQAAVHMCNWKLLRCGRHHGHMQHLSALVLLCGRRRGQAVEPASPYRCSELTAIRDVRGRRHNRLHRHDANVGQLVRR